VIRRRFRRTSFSRRWIRPSPPTPNLPSRARLVLTNARTTAWADVPLIAEVNQAPSRDRRAAAEPRMDGAIVAGKSCSAIVAALRFADP
jgi:hypothetical protein